VPRRDEGQALLELALASPILLLFLLGMVLFGRVLQAKVATDAAAREAARAVAEASSEGEGVSLARRRAADVAAGYGLTAANLGVTIDDGGFVRGGTVTVRVSYAVPIGDLPLARQVLGAGGVAVSATDQEAIEMYRARDP
jgi:Flp pilus assembly protein TadG